MSTYLIDKYYREVERLVQYGGSRKETSIRVPKIAQKFNTYRFADYKEHVLDLLARVCTVSVETVRIIGEMGE